MNDVQTALYETSATPVKPPNIGIYGIHRPVTAIIHSGSPSIHYRSLPGPIVEMHDSAAELMRSDQLQRPHHAAGQRGIAAAERDRRDEEVALVDQPCLDRGRGQMRAAD